MDEEAVDDVLDEFPEEPEEQDEFERDGDEFEDEDTDMSAPVPESDDEDEEPAPSAPEKAEKSAKEAEEKPEEAPKPPKDGTLTDEEFAALKGRKVKLKIDGEEAELTIEKAVALARKGAAAEKRFMEAAEIRKEVAAKEGQYRAKIDQYHGYLKDLMNPQRLVDFYYENDRGHILEAAFQSWMEQTAAEAQMTPEQLELKSMKRQMEAYRRQQQETAQRAQKQQEYEATQRSYQTYQGWVGEAFKECNVPADSPYVGAIQNLLKTEMQRILREENRAFTELDVSRAVEKIAEHYRPVLAGPPKKAAPPKAPKQPKAGAARTTGKAATQKRSKMSVSEFFSQFGDD
jgi:hypothetical protein